MIEDKLTADQRIRLECLAQANVTTGATAGRPAYPAKVLEIAADYERFIREGTKLGDS